MRALSNELPLTARELGENLRLRRQAVGVSMRQLSAVLGIHENRLRRIESGASLRGMATHFRALQALGFEIVIRPVGKPRNYRGQRTPAADR